MKNLVALTGAGISAESGLKTFRDSGGLWEGYDVMKVATPEGWQENQDLVLDFYNMRRSQLKKAKPNAAHTALVNLESYFHVDIVTQNVDNLHEKAGSSHVLHLHGELNKVRSIRHEELIYDWEGDLRSGDLCEKGYQLRPHIVWFGEPVPMLERAAEIVSRADILVIIGTSLQVYPAAGLVGMAPEAEVYYIDPRPSKSYELNGMRYHVIRDTASAGMLKLEKLLCSKF